MAKKKRPPTRTTFKPETEEIESWKHRYTPEMDEMVFQLGVAIMAYNMQSSHVTTKYTWQDLPEIIKDLIKTISGAKSRTIGSNYLKGRIRWFMEYKGLRHGYKNVDPIPPSQAYKINFGEVGKGMRDMVGALGGDLGA